MTSWLHRAVSVRSIGLGLLVAAVAFGAAPTLTGGVLDIDWVPQWLRLDITAALFALANLSSLWPRPSDRRRRRAWWLLAPVGYLAVVYAATAMATPPITDRSSSLSFQDLLNETILLWCGWPVWASALLVAADALWRSPLRDTAIDRRLARIAVALWAWGLIVGDAPWFYFQGGLFFSSAWEVGLAVLQPLEHRVFYALLAMGAVALGLALSRRRAGPLWALLAVFAATVACDAIELRAARAVVASVFDGGAVPLDGLARSSRFVETALVAIAAAFIGWGVIAQLLPGARARRWRASLALIPLLTAWALPPSLAYPTDRAKQRPEPLWEAVGADPATLPGVQGWPPMFRFAEGREVPAVLGAGGELHLFRAGSRITLAGNERASSPASLTLVFDRRATLGDLRRAASRIDVDRIDLAFLGTTLSEHRDATERWPFVAMAGRALRARSVYLVQTSVRCEPPEGGPAPFSCCALGDEETFPHDTAWGPRMRIEAPDDLLLAELVESASGSDGSFELFVPRDGAYPAVRWAASVPTVLPSPAPRTYAGWLAGAVLALLLGAWSLWRDVRAHRALTRGARLLPSERRAGLRVPRWLAAHDADVAVLAERGGPFREPHASSVATARSVGRAMLRALARRAWSFGGVTLRLVLVYSISLCLAFAAHRAFAPLALAEPPVHVDGHVHFGSVCGSRVPGLTPPYRGPGRCCL